MCGYFCMHRETGTFALVISTYELRRFLFTTNFKNLSIQHSTLLIGFNFQSHWENAFHTDAQHN